jgi:hypothetical protein
MSQNSSWERSMRHVRTTNARVNQMKAVGGTGSVRTIAYNPKLFAGYQKAMVKVRAAIKGKVMSNRQKFNTLRKELGNNKSLKLAGRPIHHFKPLNKYGNKALNAKNLMVTSKNNLRAGTFKSSHVQMHQTFGGKNINTKAQMFGKLAWGKQNALQRHFSFMNRGDRVPLNQVKSKIAAFEKQMSKNLKSAAPKPGPKTSNTGLKTKLSAATSKLSGFTKSMVRGAKGVGSKAPGGGKPATGPSHRPGGRP